MNKAVCSKATWQCSPKRSFQYDTARIHLIFKNLSNMSSVSRLYIQIFTQENLFRLRRVMDT
jgi:hypothetical protein